MHLNQSALQSYQAYKLDFRDKFPVRIIDIHTQKKIPSALMFLVMKIRKTSNLYVKKML